MSSLAELQEAIINLPQVERDALSSWLASQTPPRIRAEDEERLLNSLDQAARELDAGKGVSSAEARKLVRSWAGN